MAISVVASTAAGANNPLSGNFALPGAWAQNDLALVWWYSRINTKTFTDASGGLLTVLYNNAAAQGTIFIAYRVLQAGDLAVNLDWTSPTIANASVAYGTLILRGVDITTPIEANSGTPAAINNTQSPDPPAVTVATTGACVVTIFGKNNDYTTITAPASYTLGGSAEDTLGTDGSGGLAYRLNVTAGTQDPGAWTLGGLTSDDCRAWTCSVKPLEGAALAASVTVRISPVTAALTTEIRLASLVAVGVTATADLTATHLGFGNAPFGAYPFGHPMAAAAGAELQAAVTVRVTTAGALTTEIRLASAQTVRITTAASLTTAIQMAGAATLAVTTTAPLTTAISLSGAAPLAVSTAGALTTAITLAAAPILRITTTAALEAAAGLAAQATVRITTSASLTTAVGVAGAATLQITATANLTTYTPLAGTAALAVHTTADLFAESGLLAGAATLRIVTAADLTTELHLAGEALLVVLAQGILGSIPPSIVNPSVRVVKPGRTTQPIPAGRAGVVSGAGRTVGNGTGPRTAAPVRSSRATMERIE